MAIGFGKSREDDVVTLIAAKKYARAIEVLKAQLQKKGANPSLRMQLADVLILADKKQEAIGLLIPLADQFARDGFAAKAVSVLKKIQKVDPGRRDVEERLARQIEERQREAVSLPLSRPGGPSSDEAAGGFERGPGARDRLRDDGADLGPGLPRLRSICPGDRRRPARRHAARRRAAAARRAARARAPAPCRARAAPVAPAAHRAPAAQPVDGEIEDYDLLYFAQEGGGGRGDRHPARGRARRGGAAPAEPMSAGQFADELMGLVDSVFQEFPDAARPRRPRPLPRRRTSRAAAARSW